MEGKVALKNLLEVPERPYDNNTSALNSTEYSSISNTLGSTLSLSLNNPERPLHNQDQPLTQLGLLQTKLEEVKKENQNLRFKLNQITQHYAALQDQLLLAMQQQLVSASPRNNRDLEEDNRQESMERPVLHTRQFLNTGENSPSDGSTKEGFDSVGKIQTNIGRNLSCAKIVEGKISNHIGSQEARIIEDQASEASCRKARVSIRTRTEFPLMDDGCQWRKYGQKTSKGNPCPRAYYRCSMGTCPVRKQVQRCAVDGTILITTYEGTHNHPLPPAARSIASLTSAALDMLLSGSITSFHGSTLSDSGLLSSLSSSGFTGLATFSSSASCPTITLDLTQPSNDHMKFQRAISSNHILLEKLPFLMSLNGYTQQSGRFYLSSKLPAMIPSDKDLALVDVVSAAMSKDPSLKAALVAAFSSLTANTQNINNHSQLSKSVYDPSSEMPTLVLHQPCTTDS